MLEQDLPLGSQLDLFRTADEKRLAQLLFQDLHRLAHSRLGDEQEDHTMNAFLRFLDADIQNNPQKTRPFDIQQGKKLVAGMDVNIDDEIGDDE